jgi:hypothetical protein
MNFLPFRGVQEDEAAQLAAPSCVRIDPYNWGDALQKYVSRDHFTYRTSTVLRTQLYRIVTEDLANSCTLSICSVCVVRVCAAESTIRGLFGPPHVVSDADETFELRPTLEEWHFTLAQVSITLRCFT